MTRERRASRQNQPNQRRSSPRHRAATPPESALIAVELGGQWPSWMSEIVGIAPRRVLAQAEGEDCLAFAERVSSSVTETSAFSALLVVCNQRADGRQMLARRRVATRLAEHGCARIWLAVAAKARTELVAELAQLSVELPAVAVRSDDELAAPSRKLSSVA